MLLAIDTASRFMSIALHDGKALLAEQTLYSDNQHTVQLTTLIDRMLRDSYVTIQQLSLLAVSQGPGSFSGLRIGFSVAKGIATARNLPLIPIPTLDIIAASTPHSSGQATLIAVLQAGRGRVIAGRYRWQRESWQPQGSPAITAWEEIANAIKAKTLINGEIDEQGREKLENHALVSLLNPAWCLRRAGFLADLAWQRRLEVAPDLAAVNPIYLKG